MEITKEYREKILALAKIRMPIVSSYSFKETSKGKQLLKRGKFIKYITE